MKEFPLVRIRDDEHLERAEEMIDRLLAKDPADRFQTAVTELGGYTTKEMGRRIR